MDKALLKEEYKRLLRQAVGDRTGSMALRKLDEVAEKLQSTGALGGFAR